MSEGFGSFVRESSSQSTATPSPPLPLRLKGNFGIENLCLWMGFSVSVSPVHVGIVPAVRFTRSSTAVETITFFEWVSVFLEEEKKEKRKKNQLSDFALGEKVKGLKRVTILTSTLGDWILFFFVVCPLFLCASEWLLSAFWGRRPGRRITDGFCISCRLVVNFWNWIYSGPTSTFLCD